MRGRSRSIISSVISGKSRSRNGCCAARSSAIASPGTRSWTWDSSQGSMKGSFSFRKARSYWTSPRGIEASSSPRPARNSFDESRSSPWTRGSHAGSGCTRGSRSDSDSGKSTAGPPPRRRVFLKSRNTSESVLNDPAAEVPFPVCLTLKYGPDRYLPTREATRLSGVRARGGSGSVGPETRVAPASQSDRSSGHRRDQPTKIAVAAPEFGRIWGGIGTYLGQLLPGIASHHEVTILCGQTPSYETGYQTVPLADGGGVMANYFKFQRALQRRWPDLVREYRPDLLVVHHAQMPDLWTDPMPCPTVVTTHTTILGQARGIQGALRHGGPLDDTERTTLAVLPALLPIELYYWNRVRHVLFVSDAVRQEVLGTYGPRVRTSALIPNGLALDELRAAGGTPDPPEEPGFILYTGRLLGWKGLAVLLRAMVHLRRPERLVVTGSGRGMRSPWPKESIACSETKPCGGGSDERRPWSPEIDFPPNASVSRRSNISNKCSRHRNKGRIRMKGGRGDVGAETA